MPELMPSPEDVTAAWLTEALQRAGFGGAVRAFEQRDIGTGQVGRCVRFTLDATGDVWSTVPADSCLQGPSSYGASRQGSVPKTPRATTPQGPASSHGASAGGIPAVRP